MSSCEKRAKDSELKEIKGETKLKLERSQEEEDLVAAAAVQQLNHYARGLIMVQK